MQCPQCGGECYDNAQKIEGGWKGPLHKCKDRECGWVKWPPKEPKGSNHGGRSSGPRVTYTWDELGKTYQRCRLVADRVWKGSAVEKDPTALVAATATLFIAAKDMGLKVEAPKPEPKPEPSSYNSDVEMPF